MLRQLTDGQELQAIEPVRGRADEGDERRVEGLPDRIVQFDAEPRRARVAGRRHHDAFAGAEHRGAEHAADRLGETRRGVLRRRARVGIAAVPCRRAAEPRRRQAVDDEGRQPPRQAHEHEHQKAVIGTAARGDRHDREPWCADLHRHARPDQRQADRRQRVDEQPGQDADEEAQQRQQRHGGEREAVGLDGGRCGRRARPAEERHAIGFDEAGRRERRR